MDIVARLGGDEFSVLLPETDDANYDFFIGLGPMYLLGAVYAAMYGVVRRIVEPSCRRS